MEEGVIGICMHPLLGYFGCLCEFPFLVIGVYDYALVGQNWSAGVMNLLVRPSYM